MSREAALERQLARQVKARKEAERVLEEKARELFDARSNLQGVNADLESRIDERTKNLRSAIESLASEIARRRETEQQLRGALERAEAATKAKDQFLANMSHEIRTPMNGVIGMTQLLLRTELDDKQRMYAETSIRSARALLTVIDDVLDISKIEAGRLEINNRAFDPVEVVTDVESMLTATAEEGGIKLRATTPPDAPTLIGDPDRIRQIVSNLAANAMKFTAEGSVDVDLTISSNDATSARVKLTVTDTGIGIEPEKIEEIFDAFVQVDSSMTREYGGIGLGLAITKRLVELMDGSIEVTSTPGEGSTFTVWLTLDYAPEGDSND